MSAWLQHGSETIYNIYARWGYEKTLFRAGGDPIVPTPSDSPHTAPLVVAGKKEDKTITRGREERGKGGGGGERERRRGEGIMLRLIKGYDGQGG
jgi:hypothetical protein